jgi:hypothetical protein
MGVTYIWRGGGSNAGIYSLGGHVTAIYRWVLVSSTNFKTPRT